MLYHLDPGAVLPLRVFRSGQRLQLDVIVGERDDEQRLALGRNRLAQLGLQVRHERAASHGGKASAVLVSGVDPGGLAEQQGIRVGDVVTDLDARPVAGLEDALRALGGAPAGQAVLFWLQRPGGELAARLLPLAPDSNP
jgi:S1-C subfamily serine protease